MPRLIFLLVFAIGLGACSQSSKSDQEIVLLTDKNIRTKLVELMEKEDGFRFVTFIEPYTGKFVQFGGEEKNELIFDLPCEQLSHSELKKAVAILKTYNIVHQYRPAYSDETETEEVGTFSVFDQKIEGDPDLGVELTSRIMIDVFGFKKDIKLEVKTELD